jgi:hypothetical protein
VDVLNIIGLSMILMAITCGITLVLCGQPQASRQGMPSELAQVTGNQVVNNQLSSNKEPGCGRSRIPLATTSIAVAALIALLTPPLYTTWRPTWLPWWLESYIDGCHNLGAPQSWLFPLFPWAAFAFAGLAAGFILFSDRARDQVAQTLALFAGIGALAILAARQLDYSSFHLYSTYDYWHTSPNFLMMRIGLLLVIAFLTYAWCRWGWATRGFSPLLQLGQTSLLVYWVHIEFVYGRLSLLPKRAETIGGATRGLLEIIVFMLLLSLLRTRIDWKKTLHWMKIVRRVQPVEV